MEFEFDYDFDDFTATVRYNYLDGDKTVGEQDDVEFEVVFMGHDISDSLTYEELSDVRDACMADFEIQVAEHEANAAMDKYYDDRAI